MEANERNPVRVIGFIMIVIAVAGVLAANLILGEIPSVVLGTNLAMVGMGIVFVALGSAKAGSDD